MLVAKGAALVRSALLQLTQHPWGAASVLERWFGPGADPLQAHALLVKTLAAMLHLHLEQPDPEGPDGLACQRLRTLAHVKPGRRDASGAYMVYVCECAPPRPRHVRNSPRAAARFARAWASVLAVPPCRELEPVRRVLWKSKLPEPCLLLWATLDGQ